MLVLSRHKGEAIDFIANGVVIGTLWIHKVKGEKVSVSIDQFDDIIIMRRELTEEYLKNVADSNNSVEDQCSNTNNNNA